jgi:threonine dehydrogenase-like Zn-dependent dehydrogenase
VLDLATDGPKPRLVRSLGGQYLTELAELDVVPDVVIEATGAGQLVVECAKLLPPAGVLCLTGISAGPASIDVRMDALIRQLVIRNAVLVGSVNAAKRHYADAVEVLQAADPAWLGRLVTRTVPLSDWPSALVREPADIKVVVDLQA